MPRIFHIDDRFLQHPELIQEAQDVYHRILELGPDSGLASELWDNLQEQLAKRYEELGEPHHEESAQATIKLSLYFENSNGKEEKLEIDGVELGLMRKPERLTLPTNSIGAFVDEPIEIDTDRFEKLLSVLHKSRADGVISMIQNVRSKLRYIVLSELHAVPAPEGGGRQLVDLPVGRGRLMSHPFLGVKAEFDATGRLQFVQASPCPYEMDPAAGDCLVRACIETFKSGYDATHKKEKLSHATFLKYLPTKETRDVFTCNVKDITPFFKDNRVALTAFDRRGKVVYDYEPETRNKKLVPGHCYVALHNRHAYRLDANLETLSHERKRWAEDAESVSQDYPSVRINADQYELANGWDDFVAILRRTRDKTDETITIHYNDDLEQLFFKLKDEYGFEGDIRVTGDTITGMVLYLQNRYILRDFPIHNPEEGRRVIAPAYYRSFVTWLQRMTSALLNPALKSHYCENLQRAWEAYPRAQLHRRFVEGPEPVEAESVDVVRAYTANLKDLAMLPVFQELDDFQAYTGQPLEPYNIYLVETDPSGTCVDTWMIANRRWSLVSGMVLQAATGMAAGGLQIHSFIKPSQVVDNPAPGLLKELYADASLPDDLKKFVVNMVVGLCNKKWNQKEWGVYTTDIEEAAHFSKNVAALRDREYIAVNRSEKVLLHNGFLPIGFFVYDLMRIRMLKLKRQLEAHGARVYGIATDALFVDHVPSDLSYATTKRWEDLGKPHVEGRKRIPLGAVVVDDNGDKPVIDLPSRQFQSTQDLRPGTLVTGLLPGCGKTHLLATRLPLRETLFVTATNEQEERIRKAYGHDAMTLCRFLGFRVSNEGLVQGHAALLGGYKHLVVDEVYQQSILLLSRLRRVASTSAIHLYATGDPYQTGTCEAYNNIPDRKAYLKVLSCMLPWQLTLDTSHRMKDPLQVETLKAIRHALFEECQPVRDVASRYFEAVDSPRALQEKGIPRCLTLRNLTAQMLNKELLGEEKPGMRVICKTYTRQLVTNREYVVKAIEGKHYLLEGVEGQRYLKSMFRPHFCMTTHSIQGATLEAKYAIFDIASPFASREWFWTACTRSNDLRKVFVYTGPTLGGSMNVRSRLEGYKASDVDAERAFDLDAKWVLATLKAQNYSCAMCHGMLELEGDDPEAWSVDRKDNLQGHVKTNCQITHRICNTSSH
jgi:hypothetical protein